jgi:hypothetical protein
MIFRSNMSTNPASHKNYGGGGPLQLRLIRQRATHFSAAAWTIFGWCSGSGIYSSVNKIS